MKHSVVMPTLTKTREHEEVVVKCVESVNKHSSDFEFIIVNDGSTRKLGQVQRKCDTYVRHKKAQGIAPSWNDGINIARGEYICVINDDIEAQPGWLEKMSAMHEKDPKVGVSSLAVEKMPRGTGIEETHQWFPGSVFMINRNTLKYVGLFDEQFTPYLYEDVDYWTRILKSGGKMMRDFSIEIPHREGDVIQKLQYNKYSEENKRKYIIKHGFDPISIFYGGDELPWLQ